VATSGELGRGTRGVSRLAAPVLRHLADHPGTRVNEREICLLSGVDPHDGQRLAEWLHRLGLLRRETAGEQSLYELADAWEQRRSRTRPLILLVEDHSSVASMTEAVLTSEGYNVVLVRNPMEAHVILRVVNFDVILTDSFSPTLDLAVRVLGPLLRRSTVTPVVLFTAHHWDAARVQAEGFTEIIHKPFDVEDFLARIEQLAALHNTAGA
jgi:CheY-like chemotaxis protein